MSTSLGIGAGSAHRSSLLALTWELAAPSLGGVGGCSVLLHLPYLCHIGSPRLGLVWGAGVWLWGRVEGDGVSISLGSCAGAAHLSPKTGLCCCSGVVVAFAVGDVVVVVVGEGEIVVVDEVAVVVEGEVSGVVVGVALFVGGGVVGVVGGVVLVVVGGVTGVVEGVVLVVGVGVVGVVDGVVGVVVELGVVVGGGVVVVVVLVGDAVLASADATRASQSRLMGGGGDGCAKRSA